MAKQVWQSGKPSGTADVQARATTLSKFAPAKQHSMQYTCSSALTQQCIKRAGLRAKEERAARRRPQPLRQCIKRLSCARIHLQRQQHRL